MHTANPLITEPSSLEAEIAIELKRYKSTGIDQILAELIQAGGKICCEIHRLTNSVWNKVVTAVEGLLLYLFL